MIPWGVDRLAEPTAIPTRVAVVTVKFVELVMECSEALIVVPPGPIPVARPELFIVTALVEDDFHAADEVMSRVLPSL